MGWGWVLDQERAVTARIRHKSMAMSRRDWRVSRRVSRRVDLEGVRGTKAAERAEEDVVPVRFHDDRGSAEAVRDSAA